MAKVIVIGIDGFDPFLIHKWKAELPHISALIGNRNDISIDSTFPPDSICAWSTIFTGENPAEHGLIESIDYLSAKKGNQIKGRSDYFSGRTFWDILSKEKKTVCVINPFLAYPAWPVNGIMVSGPVFEGGSISVYPPGIDIKYDFPPLGGITDFPDSKTLGEFLNKSTMLTEKLAKTGLKVYQEHHPDLFFITFLTLDRVKHFLWRFTDTSDPDYPGKNNYENAIIDQYRLFDTIVGDFVKSGSPGTKYVILSDHGHQRRCTRLFNMNEFLRQKGYIQTKGHGFTLVRNVLLERCKEITVSTLSRVGLQDLIYKIAKLVPGRKHLKKSTYLLDPNSSCVHLAEFCGANPYGGLEINKDIKADGYDALRERLIKDLMDINKNMNMQIVKWAKKREDVYKGKNENALPCILFELHEDFGVGFTYYSKLVSKNHTHGKISGGHKRYAVFITSVAVTDDTPWPRSLTDVRSFIERIVLT